MILYFRPERYRDHSSLLNIKKISAETLFLAQMISFQKSLQWFCMTCLQPSYWRAVQDRPATSWHQEAGRHSACKQCARNVHKMFWFNQNILTWYKIIMAIIECYQWCKKSLRFVCKRVRKLSARVHWTLQGWCLLLSLCSTGLQWSLQHRAGGHCSTQPQPGRAGR